MKKVVIVALISSFISFSCNDDIITEPNPLGHNLENNFNSKEEAEKAVFAAYASLVDGELWGREFWWIPDLLSDELKSSGEPLELRRAKLLDYEIEATNQLLLDVWVGLYRLISRSNLAIEALPGKENVKLTKQDIDIITAEAKFLRAWAYFQLVTYWGDVPMTLRVIDNVEGIPMAGSEKKIYDQIAADLSDAEKLLPMVEEYRGTDNTGRATKGAAQALLGKVYLYRGMYDEAKTLLTKVIESGAYDLVPKYEDNHREENENNLESIWEVQFTLTNQGTYTWPLQGIVDEGSTLRGQEYSPFDWHTTLPSETLKGAFEDGDPRYKLTFIEFGDMYGPADAQEVFDKEDILQGDRTDNTHWRKYGNAYKQLSEHLWSGINHRVIRYADVLLMMAEIENELNGPTSLALSLINQVRDRVDMPNYPTEEYPTGTKEEYFKAIMHERQVEFASEQIRARDIKRWLANGKITNHTNANYQEKHKYLPIPMAEIENNPALTNADQKPGY